MTPSYRRESAAIIRAGKNQLALATAASRRGGATTLPSRFAKLAWTKSWNNGWAAVGFDLNSG